MNLPSFSVRRPIFTVMITLMVTLIGLASLSRLRIDLLPDIELPILTVSTGYEGAGPVVMEQLITQIVEEIIATVPGVRELSSSSAEGSSRVRVTFNWGVDIDTAAIDVQAGLEDEINELPEDIVKPRVSKFDVAGYPVVIMGISSPMDPVALTRIIEERLRFRLARIPGVAQVDTWGAYMREIRVELDPERLKSLAIDPAEVLAALGDANLDLPAGKIDQGRFEVTLRAPAEFASLEEIAATPITRRGSGIIRLGQLARINDSYEKRSRIIRLNRDQGLRIAIRKQPAANTVEVASGVLAEIEAINRDFPQLNVVPVINQGNFIERSIRNVAGSVFWGGGLAILVLLFFLRNLRSTLVISLSIPISIIATFAMMFLGGLTINLMTLGGLALGVGMMVDSSVVVLENIFRRHREDGEEIRQAAVEGSSEVGGAIFASTLTTLVIFLPLVFLRDVSGLLFKEFAYTVMFSLTCSLLVALSLVPMLASRLVGAQAQARGTERENGRLHSWGRRAALLHQGLDESYAALLARVIRRPRLVVGVFGLALILSLLLLPLIGSEFLPPSDEGEVKVSGEMEVGSRLDLVDRQTRLIEDIVLPAVPEALSSVTSVTSGGRNAVARGEISLALKPAAERSRSNLEIAADLRRRLEGRIPGMLIRTRAPQGQFLLERILGGDEGLRVDIKGFDLEILAALSEEIRIMLEKVPGITDVESSRQAGVPEYSIMIDRERAADLGISARVVAETLETAIAGSKAGEFRSEGESFRIFVQFAEPEKQTIDDILGIVMIAGNGAKISLRSLVEVKPGRGPALIERLDRQRVVSLKANLAGRDPGSVAREVRARLAAIACPDGYSFELSGNLEEQQAATRELTLSLILALALVFMVLACQYESLRDPLIVMASVPPAAIGVLTLLFLTDTTLNLQSYIGCIMLGGIVVNNAILLVDQAARRLAAGETAAAAVLIAGRLRLRPILMTTLTTVLALVPLALGLGEGAEAQAPLARAVVGGLTVSTLVTLILIPVVFTIVHGKTTNAGTIPQPKQTLPARK